MKAMMRELIPEDTGGDIEPEEKAGASEKAAHLRQQIEALARADEGIRMKMAEARLRAEQQAADPIIEAVRAKLLQRSRAGIAKYGTTLARTDLDRLAWLRHLQEELLDAAGYLERLIQDEEAKQPA
jgi:hypothetical protein